MTVVSRQEHFADLIERVARDGDRDAFTELFDHFAPRIKAYLMRIGAEAGLAEEVTQEVMVTLWRKAAQFDRKKATLSTWLFRVARNRRIDILRRGSDADLPSDDPLLIPEGDPDPETLIDADQRDQRVRAALADLPEEQVDLIRLSFFDGLSHGAIADRTGLPLGTVKSRIRLAFGRLRNALAEDAAGG
ncbi:sigma-70 family RNA polymerase sigma factor [Rhodobium gokarnense]|uniref:sigma-70 family RNA polymerase sigma factor n=1 Tax=Rhodobium gokarnense TaxID=364296 RepID=UPI0022240A66|nr:sigma-70 family RNA polymerase sigma factor [Rhodobium gokarnense]